MKKALLQGASPAAIAPYEITNKANTLIEYYHQGVYNEVHQNHMDEIRSAYIQYSHDFRCQKLPQFFDETAFIFGEAAWEACRKYLDAVEIALAELVRRRTTPEWLHLYRRLGVALHPALGGKVDEVTVALVREIAELAMEKHGSTRISFDLALSGSLNPQDILGGFYIKEAKRRLGSKSLAFERAKSIIRTNQIVLKRFTANDVIDLYRIEGMSYEYWRTCAALRSIGKGAGVRRTKESRLKLQTSEDLQWLIDHYDEKTFDVRFSGSLIGAWFPRTAEKHNALLIVCAGYNVANLPLNKLIGDFNVSIAKESRNIVTNFYLGTIDVGAFVDAHTFIGDAFEERAGFSLMDCAYFLHGISHISLSRYDDKTLRRLGREISLEDSDVFTLFNLLQRGYGFYTGSRDQLIDSVLKVAEAAAGKTFDTNAFARCLDYMTLTTNNRQHIGLWSHGRRFPLIPLQFGFLIDLDSLGGFLNTLFVRLRDKDGLRGLSFEIMWRAALRHAGFDLALEGEIEAPNDLKREVDAGVRVGSTLYLMECRSIELPLDFEIGKPSVISMRRKFLDEKISQVESLSRFLHDNPNGKNYDISWNRCIRHYVVSPFVEFVWSKDDRYWDGGTARIQGADAMLDILRSALADRRE